jgi:hypothetical protein
MTLRNDTPYLIKRFANAEYVEYVEDTLLDTQNRVSAVREMIRTKSAAQADPRTSHGLCLRRSWPQRFYVYVKNLSFQNLGILEDFSVYKTEGEKWCGVACFGADSVVFELTEV